MGKPFDTQGKAEAEEVTNKDQIEAMLQREGLTLETLPNRKDYKEEQCLAVFLDIYCGEKWSVEREILHQRDVIDLLCSALEKAQAERAAAIEDAKIGGCITCSYCYVFKKYDPCQSCHDFGNWAWRGIIESERGGEND